MALIQVSEILQFTQMRYCDLIDVWGDARGFKHGKLWILCVFHGDLSVIYWSLKGVLEFHLRFCRRAPPGG